MTSDGALKTSLRDGTPVLIRTVRPEDAPLLRLGFTQLSDRSRQFRFLRAVPKLGDAELAFLADLDRPGNAALGALDVSGDLPAPAGMARYVCLPDAPDRAELAITVVDSYQGRGLGTLLFGLLARHAVASGLSAFVALAAAENRAMIGMLEELGAEPTADHGSEREFLLPLHGDPQRYPETPAGNAFRAAYALAEAAQ